MKNAKLFAGVALAFAVVVFALAAMPQRDLNLPPQDVCLYAASSDTRMLPQTFMEKFLSPWTITEMPDMQAAYEMAYEIRDNRFFDGRGRRLPRSFADAVIENMNIGSDFEPQRAIVIRGADLRGIPSSVPVYSKRSNIPNFDAAQFSHLRVNTPVLLKGVSADGEFYAAYSFQGGPFWIQRGAVRPATDDDIKIMTGYTFVTPVRDSAAAYIGTLFPVIDGAPVRATPDGWEYADIDPGMLADFPVPFSKSRAAELAEAMQGPYSWGGAGGAGRDCSALTMEMFIPFGVFMPRNSRQQADYFQGIDLTGLSAADKKKTISEQAIPFETLLFFPGHIMVYIGGAPDEPLVYHSVWGLRTYTILLQESFYVIGRTVVSGMEMRKSRRAQTWLDRTEKMLFIDRAAVQIQLD